MNSGSSEIQMCDNLNCIWLGPTELLERLDHELNMLQSTGQIEAHGIHDGWAWFMDPALWWYYYLKDNLSRRISRQIPDRDIEVSWLTRYKHEQEVMRNGTTVGYRSYSCGWDVIEEYDDMERINYLLGMLFPPPRSRWCGDVYLGMPIWRYSEIWTARYPGMTDPSDEDVEEQIASTTLSETDCAGCGNVDWVEWTDPPPRKNAIDGRLIRWLLEHDPDYQRMDDAVDAEIARLRRCCARLKVSDDETERAVQDWLSDAPPKGWRNTPAILR